MPQNKFKLACIQTNAQGDIDENIEQAAGLCRQAWDDGADFVALPEVADRRVGRREALANAVLEGEHRMLAAFRDLAAKSGKWILLGSIAVKVPGEERLANRSILIGATGAVVARYDKIHMFDVQVGDGHVYRESDTYRPGNEAVVADTPFGRVGMTVCYDVRFPYLYRDLAHAGAQLIAIPANFTRVTGQAHWHVLMRARAIETGCFVFAPSACGVFANGRETYGHSLLVDPWGAVIAEGGSDDIGIAMAEIDLAAIDAARGKVPSLEHDRAYQGPVDGRSAEDAVLSA